MSLNKLTKVKKNGKKRVGRGYGSGEGGHTSGRGAKGQKARSKPGLLFMGTKMRKSLIKRLPMQRGKDKFRSKKRKLIIVNLKYLNLLADGTTVDIQSLIKNNLVSKEAEKIGVKILGEGKLEKKLIVRLPVSKGARKKIEKLGGKVEAVLKKEVIKKEVLKKSKTLSKTKKVKVKKTTKVKVNKEKETKPKKAKKKKA